MPSQNEPTPIRKSFTQETVIRYKGTEIIELETFTKDFDSAQLSAPYCDDYRVPRDRLSSFVFKSMKEAMDYIDSLGDKQ